MRILVTSDSHGDYRRLEKTAEKATPFDAFIFLGDGEKDFDIVTRNMTGINTYRVRGNNDYDSSVPMTNVIRIGSHSLLLTHGSNLSLWHGFDRLIVKRRYSDILTAGITALKEAYTFLIPEAYLCPETVKAVPME